MLPSHAADIATAPGLDRVSVAAHDPFDDVLFIEDRFVAEGTTQGVMDARRRAAADAVVLGLVRGASLHAEMGMYAGIAAVMQTTPLSDRCGGLCV